MNLSFRGWRLALSLVSGLSLALAFPSYNVPVLGWISLAGLLFAVLGAGVGEGALCGLLYGVACYSVTMSWVEGVMRQYGPMPAAPAVAVTAVLILAMSVFCLLFAMGVAWVARRSATLALVLAPFWWVALELGRSHLPQIGFPWELIGYVAAKNLALVQLTAITGIYGLSLLVAAYAALLAWALRATSARMRAPSPTFGAFGGASASTVAAPSASAAVRGSLLPLKIWTAATIALAAGSLFGPRFVPRAQPTHTARLVQTYLPQALDYPPDWYAQHALDMAQLDTLSILAAQQPGAGIVYGTPVSTPPASAPSSLSPASSPSAAEPPLIVWPEVPAPFSLQQGTFAVSVERIAEQAHGNFLVGEVDWRPSPGRGLTPYNSAALFDPQGREQFLYDKMHLVPFGEVVPWRNYFWFAGSLTGLVGDFGAGSRHAVGQLPGGKFGVFICYEAIFPDHVRQFVRNGAGLLINISNDGWFGRSAAPAQHLAMARVRAVENRRWLLRDTNNGYTVSVDPYGRIVASMPADIRGRLDAPYAFREALTIYTRWGDWPAFLSVCLSAVLFVLALRRDIRKSTRAEMTS